MCGIFFNIKIHGIFEAIRLYGTTKNEILSNEKVVKRPHVERQKLKRRTITNVGQNFIVNLSVPWTWTILLFGALSFNIYLLFVLIVQWKHTCIGPHKNRRCKSLALCYDGENMLRNLGGEPVNVWCRKILERCQPSSRHELMVKIQRPSTQFIQEGNQFPFIMILSSLLQKKTLLK